MNTIDLPLAILLATFCSQTYGLLDGSDPDLPDGYRLVACFTAKAFGGAKERFGYVAESADRIVIAFRGTDSKADWVSDAVARQIDYKFAPLAGQTHCGFTRIYSSARKQILAILKSLSPAKKLAITGHSLGGALATLCAADKAVYSRIQSPETYTFGSPRVGDPTFASVFNRRPVVSWRVYNMFDLVPLVPPRIFKSPINGCVYYYMHVQTGYPLRFRKGSASDNHAISNYIDALKSISTNQ
jgi:triacylglycerol lipase